MRQSKLLVWAWSSTLALLLSGCCCMDRCGSSCGVGAYGMAEPVGEPYCGPAGCCAPDDFICQGPLGYLRYMFTCGSGCGDYYWDEWTSDPPSCCDPCDNYGNWTGSRGCCRPLLSGFGALWGYRYDGGCDVQLCEAGCGGGCDAGCGGGAHGYQPHGPVYHGDGTIVEQGPWVESERLPPPRRNVQPPSAPAESGEGINPSAQAPRRLRHNSQRTTMRPVAAQRR